MITEEMYLLAKKVVKSYESEQLNIPVVMPRIVHFTDEVGCIYKLDDPNIDINITIGQGGELEYAIKLLGQHHYITVVPIYVA